MKIKNRYTQKVILSIEYDSNGFADLRDAILWGADLRYAKLRDANLQDAQTNYLTTGIHLACPEEGEFVAWKKIDHKIIKLLIPSHAKRSSATTPKCRASEVIVLDIEGDNKSPIYHNDVVYEIGKTVYPDAWDDNRWKECSNGIHFFMNKENAINW